MVKKEESTKKINNLDSQAIRLGIGGKVSPEINESLYKEKMQRRKDIQSKRLKVRNTKKIKESILNTTSPYVFANKKDQKIFEELAKEVKTVRLGGDCYSYCLLADGHIDLILESGLKPWDIRALEPIIVNAGGILKTWEGNEILYGGRIIAATNDILFEKARRKMIIKKPS